MKIGIVSSEYPPFHGGGIATYAANVSRFLAAEGHEVHVIANRWPDFGTAGDGPAPAPGGPPAPRVIRLDAFGRSNEPRPPHHRPGDPLGDVCRRWGAPLYWSLRAAVAVEELHRAVGLDVVEFPECFGEAYITLRRRVVRPGDLDVPVVVTLHSPSEYIYEYNKLSKYSIWFQRLAAMEAACIRGADALVSPSLLLARMVRELAGLDGDQAIEIIPYPMDFDAIPPGGSQTPAEDSPPTILFVGRVEPRKGCRDLVDAAVRVMGDHSELRVRLVGRDCEAGEEAGSMRASLLGRIPEGLRSRFAFDGLAPRERVLRLYAEATACVFPPPWDNFPYTCCEAMAAGACVVAARNSGMAEVIEHEESGLLFPSGDVEALAAAIRRVLLDRPLREKLRRNAPARARSLTDPGAVVRSKVSHYEETIARYRRRRRIGARGPARPARVAVFVAGAEGRHMGRTIESVRLAAGRAGIEADVATGPELSRVEGTGEGDPSARRSADPILARWVRHLDRTNPEYLMRLDSGASLGEDYFKHAMAALEDDRVAWATTWARPEKGHPPKPYAGTDFSLPLDLMFHEPVPFAVIREAAFRRVGGWNLALPGDWRGWDLWLAFHQDGWEGVVVPEWAAEYRPSSVHRPGTARHPNEHRIILEHVVRRNKAVISRFATTLWLNQSLNPLASSPSVNRSPRQGLDLVRLGARQVLERLGLLELVRRALSRRGGR